MLSHTDFAIRNATDHPSLILSADINVYKLTSFLCSLIMPKYCMNAIICFLINVHHTLPFVLENSAEIKHCKFRELYNYVLFLIIILISYGPKPAEPGSWLYTSKNFHLQLKPKGVFHGTLVTPSRSTTGTR